MVYYPILFNNFHFVKFVTGKRGMVRKAAIGCFLGITLILSAYSNTSSRAWKDSDSIKNEIRELLEQCDDSVPPEFEQLIKDDKKEECETDEDEEKTDLEEKSESVEEVTVIER